MYDAVGVCSICAQVCHKGHSMSYAKYSSFFCERGGMCQALTARVLCPPKSPRIIDPPRCTQYRAMGEKLAYVMALCALLNPVKSRLMPLEQLLQLSDYSINCGVRDGLLNASQTQGQAQPNGKLSLTYTEPSQPYCPFPNCIK